MELTAAVVDELVVEVVSALFKLIVVVEVMSSGSVTALHVVGTEGG